MMLNSNNAVRRILGEPLLLKMGNGRYLRDDNGHFLVDQESEKFRLAITQNNRLGSFGSFDHPKAPKLQDIEIMKSRLMWMSYTPEAGTQAALRRCIRDMHKVTQTPRNVTRSPYLYHPDHHIFTSNLCMEIWPSKQRTHLCTWGMSKKEVKFWEHFDKRMEKWKEHVDARLSAEYDKIVMPLPIDPRYDRFAQAYPFFSRAARNHFHNPKSTDRKY